MHKDDITLVTSKRKLFSLNLKELWNYRDLITLFVKRDLKNSYKQTILGPLWILLNPFLSTFAFTIIFGIIAGISTDGIPQFLFYMSGNILWTYFSSCLNRSSSVFLGNVRLFGKVYFPRLAIPVASVFYNSVTFLIQFTVYIILVAIYMFTGSTITPNIYALLLPILILQTALLGTGCGLVISSLTTKYRDLNALVSFGVSIWMYFTPIVYPISQVPEKFRWIMMLNPVAPIVETFRYAILGTGTFNITYLLISTLTTIAVLFIGIIIFNQVEKNFIDTV